MLQGQTHLATAMAPDHRYQALIQLTIEPNTRFADTEARMQYRPREPKETYAEIGTEYAVAKEWYYSKHLRRFMTSLILRAMT